MGWTYLVEVIGCCTREIPGEVAYVGIDIVDKLALALRPGIQNFASFRRANNGWITSARTHIRQ